MSAVRDTGCRLTLALTAVWPIKSELEWSLIESAPYGPGFTAKLDDRTWWVTQLRERAQRAGLL